MNYVNAINIDLLHPYFNVSGEISPDVQLQPDNHTLNIIKGHRLIAKINSSNGISIFNEESEQFSDLNFTFLLQVKSTRFYKYTQPLSGQSMNKLPVFIYDQDNLTDTVFASPVKSKFSFVSNVSATSGTLRITRLSDDEPMVILPLQANDEGKLSVFLNLYGLPSTLFRFEVTDNNGSVDQTSYVFTNNSLRQVDVFGFLVLKNASANNAINITHGFESKSITWKYQIRLYNYKDFSVDLKVDSVNFSSAPVEAIDDHTTLHTFTSNNPAQLLENYESSGEQNFIKISKNTTEFEYVDIPLPNYDQDTIFINIKNRQNGNL